MFRRSRLSIRPNVGTTGRTAGTPQEPPLSSKDSDIATSQAETPVSVTDAKSAEAQNEPPQGDSTDQSGEGSSAIQRRKRFSVKPKVVPGRPSALHRTPKSPVKPVLPLIKSPDPVIIKTATTTETNSTTPDQEILSSKDCILSKTDIVSPAEVSSKAVHHPADTGKIQTCSQVKEISPKALVPPSIPDKETIEISEKAKTLVSKTDLTTSSQQFSLSQLLNDKADLVRLEKARKLRQLLKEEMLKGKSKKAKPRANEHDLDPSKMTMRDLIHYLPLSNPMSSSLEESQQENEIATPQSPEREASPEREQETEVQPNMLSPSQGEMTATTSAAGEDEEEEADEDEDALMVPQVKVAEDGTLIIDEESLTVEVQRMKGPNTIQDRDPIFERGSTTTYSSFRKGTHTKPWSTEETDMFFLAISMVGTDFTMICQLFPHRARSEIKNKFKKEERHNAWRIDKAFKDRRKLDLEYFKKLLEKIIEFQESKKKLKSVSQKKQTPKKHKRKTKGKKATPNLSDVEEETEDEMSNEEQEGEKENLCNEEAPAPKPKRKRKDEDDHSPDPQHDKKKRKGKTKNVPDSEGIAPPEDECEKTEDSAKSTEAKSRKRGNALNPIGSKSRTALKSKATVSEGESTSEEMVEGQINKETCSSQKSTEKISDNDSSDQETTVLISRPTRSGRISKPVQALNYPAKEDTNSSDTTMTSPARKTATKAKGKGSGKRGRTGRSAQQQSAKESKKPKLITLRASQSEESDNEEEEPDAPHDDDENSTSAFVPASLCSPRPVVPQVEETMEELDILTHMPDVLGLSKNALCPDDSCEQVQNESGTVEPCEHQLDLLVDVIDFLSEHTETSGDEGYNEAAQTLLTFGNLASLSQPTESQSSMSDHTSNIESSQCIEVDDTSKSSLQLEECPQSVSQPSTEDSATVQLPVTHTSDTQAIISSGELCSTQEKSSPLRKGRFSKIKPKPNLGSRTTKLCTQTVGAAIETKRVELDTATISHPQSSEQLEFTRAVSKPSHTENRPTDNATKVMPASCISNKQVGYDQCGIPETAMCTKLTPETTNNLSLIKEDTTTMQNVLCNLRTTTQTVEERTQISDDIATTSQLRSLEYEEDSTQTVSGQSNTKNLASLSTRNEMPESHTSDTQVIKPSDESCSSRETTTSQLASVSANNSPISRKGRLSNLKPKPNIGCASRATKLSSKSSVTNEEKRQIECEIAATGEPQSPALSVSESATVSYRDHHQESLTFNSQGIEPDPNSETSRQEQTQQTESQSTFHTYLSHLQEKCGTASVQYEEKPPDQPKPVKSTTDEPGNMHSTQSDHSSEEDKTANTGPVQQSHPSSESSKLGTHQRRRWIPKVKPNLVLSPRTTKSKVEAKEKSHATVKASSVAATSEQKSLQESTSAVPHEDKSVNLEPTSSSAVASKLDISLGTVDTADMEQAPSGLKTNFTNIKSSSVSELECATFDSGKSVQQPPDTTLNNTGICQNSRASSSIHLETSEISTGHPRPVDGAVEPSSTFQHNNAVAFQALGSSNVQDSSVQNNFQYQNLFPSMLPDHVPSDPDEPFFILSLTEIPVCPSGEAVDSEPKSCLPPSVIEAQQRNPVEPVVPPVAGIDISLSNIDIPTPEKAALRSGHICVEEYLPSAPSVDISILVEPQEKLSVRSLNLSEPEDNRNSNIMNTPSIESQTPVRDIADTKPNGKRQNLTAKEATKHTDRTQDPAQVESREMFENINSTSQKESDDSLVTNKIKRKSAETSGNTRQNSIFSLFRKIFASNEAKVENSWQKRKSAAVKSPEALSLDYLKDSSSSSCTVPGSTQESNQQSSLHGTPERLVSQSDSTESSLLEEEPTNVSQYFIGDVFTEVKSDDCPVPVKSNDTTGAGQTAETIRNKSQNRKTKAPCDPSIGQCVTKNDSTVISLLDEEPTSVSQYLVEDAFTEVESGNISVTGKSNKDKVACDEKTPAQTSETIGKKRQKRKTKASSDPPCAQYDPLTEGQPSEASVANETQRNVDVKQFHTERTRGKEQSSRNNKSTVKARGPRPQRQCTAALKSPETPETPSAEKIKETPTKSVMEQPQLPVVHQSDTKESSDDEPTDVSEYFLSDVFTEVDDNFRP
ncbi:transcription factor TFIIIB component B'' homolog isoform X2 [Periophthalmus magnuspinnatus]|uniref:transcription factor TFIIIB component B'' homolog isoform X2 n=1 Tax=Periophthalmus magnuspinnatus TaxID=409849 RepID=UPI0024365F44|nr:transcription factor TFIIIB component B'' homolog isoform X2 [Periophthalmus magnuspinnatus]